MPVTESQNATPFTEAQTLVASLQSDPALPLAEFAELLASVSDFHVSIKTLRRWIAVGKIEPTMVGGRIGIRASQLSRIFEDGKRPRCKSL